MQRSEGMITHCFWQKEGSERTKTENAFKKVLFRSTSNDLFIQSRTTTTSTFPGYSFAMAPRVPSSFHRGLDNNRPPWPYMRVIGRNIIHEEKS